MNALRLDPLRKKTGLSTPSIYRKLDPKSRYYDPDFPRPRQLGRRCVAWLDSEVDAYLKQRPATLPANEQRKKQSQKEIDESL